MFRHDGGAVAVRHHGHDRVHGIEFHRIADMNLFGLQGAINDPADSIVPAEPDERKVPQRVLRRSIRNIPVTDDHQTFLEHGFPIQFAVEMGWLGNQRGVDLAGQDLRHKVAGKAAGDPHL